MRLIIELAGQILRIMDKERLLREYPVSTARLGAGEARGSFHTPRGRHVVRAKIGAGLPEGAVLKGRRWTGEIATAALVAQNPERDWILSRILWLSGCQPGFNRLGVCDTMARYIYIHGTPDSEPIGVPQSHGCIRMRNADVIELFDLVPAGSEVLIVPPDAGDPAGFPLVRIASPDAFPGLFANMLPIPGFAAPVHWVVWDWQGAAVASMRLAAEGRLDGLTVLPVWRGKGLETRLLQTALDEAKKRGWFELRALADSGAMNLFSQAGFELVGERVGIGGVDHWMMRLFL